MAVGLGPTEPTDRPAKVSGEGKARHTARSTYPAVLGPKVAYGDLGSISATCVESFQRGTRFKNGVVVWLCAP